MNQNRLQAVTSVLTLSEVLPKPVETGNEGLAQKFLTYLKSGPNLSLITIGETISESAGILRGKHPYLKTVDAIQIRKTPLTQKKLRHLCSLCLFSPCRGRRLL